MCPTPCAKIAKFLFVARSEIRKQRHINAMLVSLLHIAANQAGAPCSLWLRFAWVVDDAKCIVVTRVCVCVCPRPHADVTLRHGRGCPLVVHYWADLQSVHGLRCYDNIAPNAKCQRVLCTRSMPGLCIFFVATCDVQLKMRHVAATTMSSSNSSCIIYIRQQISTTWPKCMTHHKHSSVENSNKKASIRWQDSARRQFQAGLIGDVGL